MYKILAKDGRAKRAQLETVHGTIQTPVFMNVGTVGAMKGAVATTDMQHIICMFALAIRLFANWEDCIILWHGISRS